MCQRRAWAKQADEGNGGLQKRRAGAVKEEKGSRWGRVGQKAEWAGWLLGWLGRKLKKILSE
jgi:hypothetical protein